MTAPDRSRTSWTVLAVLAGAAIARAGCDGGGGDKAPPQVADAMAATLAETWPEALEPALARVQEQADLLVTATDAWSEAEASGTGADEAYEAARDAWWATMDAWQEVEVMQIGPIASALGAVGGQGLRDEVYSWPTTNRCRVDQETLGADWQEPDFLTTSLVNVYGLAALETLLYSPAGENGCDAVVDINASGEWDALGAAAIQELRAGYALVLARGVAAAIGEMRDAWDPAMGDFAGTLAGAGETGSAFDTQEAGLNAVFDALFYIETATKEKKLAHPLGLRECVGEACLETVESRLAGGSNAWIVANLRGFRALYTGGEDGGMDAVLRAIGQEDLDAAVLAALDEADAAAAALSVPVDEAATTDPTDAIAALDAIKGVTDLLKGDVATVLVLQVPSEAAGDND